MTRLIVWLIALATNPVVWAAENPLSASTDVSNEGYLVLNWDASQSDSPLISDSPLVLEQSNSADFDSVIAREVGAEGAATITGLEDGQYYFRLSSAGNALTDPVLVTVQHHSMVRAGTFFVLGACLFTLLIVVIITGNRRTGS